MEITKNSWRNTVCWGTWFFSATVIGMGACASTGQQGIREKSVKPGINARWKSPKIEPLVKILESESREIYTQRELLAEVAGPKPGSAIADIGAGSGFMTEQFSKMVGPDGKVYAVDINPKMMERIADQAKDHGLTNIKTVVCHEDSVDLPNHSVDMVFICDVYHHFEYPVSTMRSIYQALKPGGEIVLVDFKRIPGVTKDWIMKHVRAGQEKVTQEIVSAGFEVVKVYNLPTFKENYIVRFRKVGFGL